LFEMTNLRELAKKAALEERVIFRVG